MLKCTVFQWELQQQSCSCHGLVSVCVCLPHSVISSFLPFCSLPFCCGSYLHTCGYQGHHTRNNTEKIPELVKYWFNFYSQYTIIIIFWEKYIEGILYMESAGADWKKYHGVAKRWHGHFKGWRIIYMLIQMEKNHMSMFAWKSAAIKIF